MVGVVHSHIIFAVDTNKDIIKAIIYQKPTEPSNIDMDTEVKVLFIIFHNSPKGIIPVKNIEARMHKNKK